VAAAIGGKLQATAYAGDTSKARLRSIGDQFTADWLKRAGPNGQAANDAYKKM
jgi:hypothetical protein